MYVADDKTRELSRLFGALVEATGTREIREAVAQPLLRLLHADYYASYVWDDARGIFGSRVTVNLSDANLDAYDRHYRYCDPITSQLAMRRSATPVNAIMPQAALVKTEFFNDFLYKDGLYWGMNLHVWDDDRNIGDLRIWRGEKRTNFTRADVELLDLIAPAFTAALRRARAAEQRLADHEGCSAALSCRERQIVVLVADGCSDKQIAQRLGIGFTTVRTHLGHIFEKLNVNNRVKLACRLAAARAPGGTGRR